MKTVLKQVFSDLNKRVETENEVRWESGALLISKALIEVLGQASLLIQPELTMQLDLVQTGDLDAKLRSDNFVKAELKKILPKYQLLYDEDSDLIFIPEGSQFEIFADYKNVEVKVIDPESALVSKAVKAPGKNKQLIRAAIASGEYQSLVERIIAEGGDLNNFK